MTAREYIKRHVKKGSQSNASVLALLDDNKGFWHVHWEEELPKEERVVITIKEL